MDTPKQTASVLFIVSIILFLCFFNKCDLSSIISLLSDIFQLINRRNMILLCHFILLFIVKDSGLLSPRRKESSMYKEIRVAPLEKEREFEVKEVQLKKEEEIRESYIHSGLLSSGRNELSVYKENRVAPLEKEPEFEVKEFQLEEEEEIRESYIDRSWDIVVIENRNEVIETNGEEEQMEKMESSREVEVWEVMQRREVEEELEKERVCVIEQNGEDEIENESVEELHKKIEEFIGRMKRQIVSEIEVSGVADAETTPILLLSDAGSPA